MPVTGRAVKRWHQPEELDRLAESLAVLRQVNDSIMTLQELDGFCTGLILCPELIRSERWLKEIWGGVDEPEFESVHACKDFVDLVMDHCDRIAAQLADSVSYWPILRRHRGSDTLVADHWVQGFFRAALLSPEGWEAFLNTADVKGQVAFTLLLELSLIRTSESMLDEAAQFELVAKAPELIPKLVLEMNRSTTRTLGHTEATVIPFPRKATLWQATSMRIAFTCSCGSGREHYRCCGSN
jgi:uncharacterized protein